MRTPYFQRNPEIVVILAGVAAALHVAKLSPALPVLRETLGVSLLQAGFLLSLVQLAGMLLGLAVGVAADGIGLKRSMLIGLSVLSAAGALGASAQDPASLLLLRACEGFGFLLTVMPAPGLIRRMTPPAHMQAAFGLWGAYMPLGTALALGAGPLLIEVANWRMWWLVLAAGSLAMAAWVYRAVAPDAPRTAGTSPSGTTAGFAPVPGSVWMDRVRRTLRAPGPWLVGMAFALYSAQWLAVIGFLPSIAAQNGRSVVAMGPLMAATAMSNAVGNVAAGRLLQRGVPARFLLYGGFATMAVGALVAFADVAWSQDPDTALGVRYLGALLLLSVGGLIPGSLFSLAVQLAPDESSVSTTVGWMQQMSSLGQFMGPPLVAWVAAAAGGWHWTWVVTGTFCCLGMLVARRIGVQVGHAGK